MKPYFTLLLGFLLYSSLTQGQEIKFHQPIGDISQHTITSMIQDDQGFLWFGTRYGLNKYNGVAFTSFFHDPDNENSLSNSSIISLLQDRDGNIWVGTHGGGVSIYDTHEQTFIPLSPHLKNALRTNSITALYEDVDGGIWIGTEKNGLKLWEKKTETLHHFFHEKNQKNSIPHNYIDEIAEDKNGIIWITTWGGGMCQYNKEKKLFTIINSQSHPNLKNDNICSFHLSKQGNIWVGTTKGIRRAVRTGNQITFHHLQSVEPEIEKKLEEYAILSILEDSRSRLWIGTENHGIFIYDLQSKRFEHYEHEIQNIYSLRSNSIWQIMEDNQGTVWIGMFKSGINKFDPFEQKFNHISDGPGSKLNLSYGLVSSFSEDRAGNIWIGTDGGGLNFIDWNQEDLNIQQFNVSNTPELKSDVIVSLLHDQQDQLWIATWGEGLFIKDQNNNFKAIRHDPNNTNTPSSNHIMVLHQDHNKNIWMASHRIGLDLYVPEEDRFYHFSPSVHPNSISSSKVIAITHTEEGILWTGSENGGLDRITLNDQYEIESVKNFIHSPEDKNSLANNFINYLYIDSNNKLWIGTDGGGLNLLEDPDDETFKLFTIKDGLPSNVIYGIVEETPDIFWVSTNSGLASINLQTNEIKTFDLADGLQAKEFNKAACYKTKDDLYLFGGINGFNYFNPQQIIRNASIPPVYITEVSIQGEEADGTFQQEIVKQLPSGKITLAADQNDIRINFAALNYSQSTQNQYAYQLENHDSNWKTGKNITSVAYSNLPPGEYTFRVKASNNDAVWNEEGSSLSICVTPPWYQRWWAYALYALTACLFLLIIFRFLLQRERLKAELEGEHIETLRMQDLNQLRSQFFANISHEFKTPLTLIISPLKAMQKKLEKIENKNQVNVMLRNAERLLRLINQILDLSKLESGIEELKTSQFDIVAFTENLASNFQPYSKEQFITFKLELPKEPIPLYFEKDKMEKILINLISNAFKYTPEFGTISLSIAKQEKNVVITMSDTGIGISPDQLELIFNRFYQVKNSNEHIGTGIGLSLTKQLVELHGGTIEVKSTAGRGTQFDVTFPLGKEHLLPGQIKEGPLQHSLSEDSRIELQEFNVAQLANQEKMLAEDSNLPLILIVDDNPDLRAFTRTYLQTNYRIIEAENGRKAFGLAEKFIPDLIITDLMMPQMNGLELCEKLRKDEKTNHIFVIMLTVKSSEESKKMGFEYGADYYVTKPFNPKLLDLRIKNILSTRDQYKHQVLKGVTSTEILPLPETKVVTKEELFLEKIVEIIEANMHDSNFQIEDLCRELGFSKSQLYRKLKGLIGQSANEFIRTIRLKKAAELLANPNLNISEITYKVGFNDLQYFRNCFKKQYDITPSEYAQQFKEKI